MKSTTSRICIMKIASGSMNGQELMLTADEHMIVIDPNVEYRAEVDEKGFTTYYIPSNSNHYELAIQSNNIDGSNDSNATFSLYINDGIKSFKTPIVYQELMLTDSFPIVFKQLDTPWELTLTDSKTTDIFIEKEQKNKLINTTSKWNFIFLALFF
ncbi:hypothetical protein AB6G19_20725 [Providencia manganoxydans]|uniref:hypothetical protein n=1 Tax=Providencia manganoxydans TaxID=2923283 RepID=UPI0034DD235F